MLSITVYIKGKGWIYWGSNMWQLYVEYGVHICRTCKKLWRTGESNEIMIANNMGINTFNI